MTAKVTLIIFILLSLMVGVCLTLVPWVSRFPVMSDWGDNYLLVYAASQTGVPALRQAVASGWVRGAVTALGVLNLIIAFWEIANFNRSVRQLETEVNGEPQQNVQE
jgi:ABC-type uncharacterized transport system YnjBCD permease subunit